MYLGPKLGLAPLDENLRFAANGFQLTIADLVTEVHDTHHPIASGLYYEDHTKPLKHVRYFEHVLKQNPQSYMLPSAAA